MTKIYGTPGPRAIHPEICFSQSLGRCGVLANLLYHRLTAQAVDQGRLPGGALDVKTRCVPYLEEATLASIAEALDSLESEGWIERYVCEGETYLQITKWWKEQHGARRAYKSECPGPDGWEDYDFGYPGGPSKPDFARIFASRGKPRQNAAKGRQAPQDPALSVSDPVPVPITEPARPGTAPSWDESPWPTFHDLLNPPGARESG